MEADAPTLLFAELEPSRPNYSLLTIPSLSTRDPWVQELVDAFSSEKCGVCYDRPLATIALSRSWPRATPPYVYGFLCCDAPACLAVSQLRADTRLANFQVMRQESRLTTSESVLKACAHCANAREVTKTRKCGRCLSVRYCGTACQHAHWPHHKKKCHPPRIE